MEPVSRGPRVSAEAARVTARRKNGATRLVLRCATCSSSNVLACFSVTRLPTKPLTKRYRKVSFQASSATSSVAARARLIAT